MKKNTLALIRICLTLSFLLAPFSTSWSASISGKVKDELTSKKLTSYAWVDLYQWDSVNGWYNWIDYVFIDGALGEVNYQFNDIPVGLYYISASGSEYKYEYYDNQTDWNLKTEIEILDASDALVLNKIFLTPYDFNQTLKVKAGYEMVPPEGGVVKLIATYISHPTGSVDVTSWITRTASWSTDRNYYYHSRKASGDKTRTVQGDSVKAKKVFTVNIPSEAPSGYHYFKLNSSTDNTWAPLGNQQGVWVYKEVDASFIDETTQPPEPPQQQESRIPARISRNGEVLEWKKSR